MTTPYLSRCIGAEGMGKYAYSYSVAYVFFIFIKLGLNSYGNRQIAICRDDDDELNKTFSNVYAMQLLTTVFVSVLYVLYAVFAQEKLFAFIMIFYVISGGLDISWFYFGIEEFRLTAIRDIVIKILTLLCVFVFVKDSGDAWKYALIRSFGAFLCQCSLWIFIKSKVHITYPTLTEIRRHILPNLILFIPTIAMSVYKYMDKVMLGAMTNKVEVGLYHSCENIIAVPLALVTALGTIMMPKMSNMFARGENKGVERIIQRSAVYSVSVTTFIGFGMMTVAKEFVPLFYGNGFEKCEQLYYIILPSCVFVAFANVIRTQYLIPQKMDKVYVSSLVAGAFINIIFNFFLIPIFESSGAAFGTFIAEVTVCWIQCAAVWKRLPIKSLALETLGIVFIGVIVFAITKDIYGMNGNLIVKLIIKLAIYSLASFTIGLICFCVYRSNKMRI
jgi:O-antigen/teichoic acid export membrane protein